MLVIVSPAGQLMVALPPSYAVPQAALPEEPHTLAVPPPPHVSGSVHVPQLVTVRAAPQLSVPLTEPQFFPRSEQNAPSLSGVHAGVQIAD